MVRIAVLAGLVLALAPAAADDGVDAVSAASSDLRLTARYAGSVLALRVGAIEVEAAIGETGYAARTHVEAAGLAAFFTDFEIDAEVAGEASDEGWRPIRYAHVERNGDKVRRVEVGFESGRAESAVTPPFGSWGVPPASAEDREGVIDPVSAVFFLAEAFAARGAQGCAGRLPVFDGKQRYDLRLEARGESRVRTRAWRGRARVCDAYYEPVSGYDPEDYPSEREMRRPLTLWLAPFRDGAVWVPVRARTRAGFGVTVEALEIRVEG